MLKAFCRVAPSVRFRDLAIILADCFLRAIVFSSRTCAGVQARFFFDPFFMTKLFSGYKGLVLLAGNHTKEKPRVAKLNFMRKQIRLRQAVPIWRCH